MTTKINHVFCNVPSVCLQQPNNYMWHVYWEYYKVKLITSYNAFMSYPLELALKYNFIL